MGWRPILSGGGGGSNGEGNPSYIGGFGEDDLAASLTDSQLFRVVQATQSQIPVVMTAPGSIIGISVAASAARTAGTATFEVFKNDVATGLTAVLDATDTQFAIGTQSGLVDTFIDGDRLDVRVTTDGAWAPTTADVEAVIVIADEGVLLTGYSPILDRKPTIDTPDDEFDNETLDGKWTTVSGVSGTIDQFAVLATNSPIFDLSTRPGWLLTQVRQNDGNTTGAVRLRQDFTLADGESIIVAHTLPTYSGLTATDNESAINITLNDTDSDFQAGNKVIIRWIVASAEQVQVYGGLVPILLHNIHEVGRIVYSRILRKDDGATEEYYLGLSEDGTNWNWVGASAVTGFAPGAELTNLWLVHDSTGGVGAEESPIVGFYFVRQGNNNFDPWIHSKLLTLAPAGRIGEGTELTIAAGIVRSTTGFHLIDTESDAGTDDLDTINGASVGQLLVLKSADDARDPTIKDATGNILLAGSVDFTLSDTDDTITLVFDGTNWLEVSRSDNS